MSVLATLLLLLLAPGSVWAQSTAQISGNVTDPSGAVLPGVGVTVTQTGTGISRSAVTNETGSYLLPSLPIGPYKLEAALPGFRTYSQTGITLQVGSNPLINVRLEVGQVSETIEVQADATLVETRNTGVSQMIDNTRVLELPLNGRNVQELVLLSGVANVSTDTTLNPGTRNYPTTIINVAGGLQTGLTYMLDGANHNDAYNNLNYPLPFPDALQEFKVETSGLEASYGFHSSGQVNAVTKSGTNQFHGDAFEFLRNGSLNARNAFAITDDGLKRNQFGGTVGGPIIRNKLFFFGGEQGTKQRSAASNLRAFIPTPAMLAGDFTAISSPECNSGKQVTLRAPYTNNKIDPALFSPAALNIVKHNLFPKTTDPCGLVRFGGVTNIDEWLTVGRVDYQLNDKQSLFARYLDAWREQPSDYDGVNVLTISQGVLHHRVHTLALGHTYLIGSKAVASFRGGIKRAWIPKETPKAFDLTSVGVKGIFDPRPGYAMVTVSNGFTIGSGLATQGFENTVAFDLNEDLSIERGNHQFGLGATWVHQNLNGRTGFMEQPAPTFDGHFTGTGLSDFMLGKAATFAQGNSIGFGVRQNSIGLYIKDTWKVTSRLTASPGLRWEPHFAPYRPQLDIALFKREWFDQGIKSTTFTNAPAGLVYMSDPLFPVKGGKMGFDSWLHFAPRFGLAWDVQGDGRTTLRSAYGLFFDLPPMYHYGGNDPPISNLVTLNDPPGGLDNPWQGYPGGNPLPTPIVSNAPFGQQVAILNYPVNLASAYVHQWNLSLQRQLGADWMVSANYIGNSTIHAQSASEGNPAIYLPGVSCVINGTTYSPCSTTGNTNQRRALYLANPIQGAYYSTIRDFNSDGTASYNGMLLSVQHRRSNGMTIQGNYTWSHCISDPIAVGGNSTTGQLVYPGRRGDERQGCVGDFRHTFNMSTVYEIPRFSSSALRMLATGWQLSSIVRIQSGDYFTVTSSLNTALRSGIGTNRVNQVLSDPYLPDKGVNGWLNSAAFAIPTNGSWGNASYNIEGPGTITINAGLTRSFRITEGQTVQFRAEAFNLPNHMNPGDPIAVLNNQNFGKIFSAKDPRIMQLALKYVF
jgi:hypothetical protein